MAVQLDVGDELVVRQAWPLDRLIATRGCQATPALGRWCGLATAMPGRIGSLTLLNSTIDVTDFKSPWSME